MGLDGVALGFGFEERHSCEEGGCVLEIGVGFLSHDL